MLLKSIFSKKQFQLFCFIVCSAIPVIDLNPRCLASTQEKDEIIYVLPPNEIPAIKNPEFVPASEAGLDNDEPVIGVTINGESRAYSVYLLNHHEIVNDKVGGDEIAVIWCPLANLTVVYSRKIDGRGYTFGVSGKLLKNTLVMYDFETKSLWPIVYGRAVDGELSGKKLNMVLKSQRMPWGVWKELHPDTLVLSSRGLKTIGFDIYSNYHKGKDTGIHTVKNLDKRLSAKTNVIGVEINGKHKAYPFSVFDNAKIVTDEFQGLNLLVYRNKETNNIMVYDRGINGHVIDFAADNITKTTWDLENGIGIRGSMKGKSLRRVNFIAVYWFVWADYFPGTEIFYP